MTRSGPRSLHIVVLATTVLVTGCATLPPGLDAPKSASTALAQPETTTLGRRLDALASNPASICW